MAVTNTFRIALTTAGSDDEARTIARAVVERGLAACVNVVSGVRSVYRWKGEIAEDDERLLIMKTDAAHVEPLRSAIRELHSYEVPEFVVVEVVGGDQAYLEWLAGALSR